MLRASSQHKPKNENQKSNQDQGDGSVHRSACQTITISYSRQKDRCGAGYQESSTSKARWGV